MGEDRIIETRRLALRPLRRSDGPLLSGLDWLDGERVMERSGGAESPYGFRAVVIKETGEACGLCGLLRQRLDHGEEIEVGYHLLPGFRGRGIATEAARGVMEYAFARLGHGRLVSLIRADNPASLRVAQKNGLRHERDLMFRGQVHGMHVIAADTAEGAV